MGCAQSSSDEGSSASKQIDQQLAKERAILASVPSLRNGRATQTLTLASLSKTITIFLAGTGESGKSTVVKQLRLKYADPYADEERDEYRSVILSNLVQSMVVILDAMSDFGLELRGSEQEKWFDIVNAVPSMVDELSPAAIEAIEGLWRAPEVKKCLEHASKFQLNDSAAYFFDNLDRLTSPTFLPTDDDILRARVRTTGIIEARFKVKDRIYKVLDVGGQRSERRKWIACFENVDVLLFLFAVSEFDQQLYEDETQNRFIEAENLFGSISNSLWFKNSTLIVFFNKIDLFDAKIEAGVQLADHLEGFPATDTRGINVILGAVQDQINTNMLKDAYML
ncbi:hypothetical protein RQP46_003446 [Phenoliferia psychrophenolica]